MIESEYWQSGGLFRKCVGVCVFLLALALIIASLGGTLFEFATLGSLGVFGVYWALSALLRPRRCFETPRLNAFLGSLTGFGKLFQIGDRNCKTYLTDGQLRCAKAVRKWTRRAKLHFGVIDTGPAGLICLRRWLAEQMKEDDMREKDMAQIIPLVVIAATLKHRCEVEADALLNTGMYEWLSAMGKKGM